MGTPPRLPKNLDAIWAKSSIQDGIPGQSLVQHTWEALERLSDLAHLRPNLTLWPRFSFWNIAFWATWLHDWGKVAQGFQKALRNGPRWSYRHEVLSIAFSDCVCADWPETDHLLLTAMIVTHHRDLADITEKYLIDEEDEEDDPLQHLVTEVTPADFNALWLWPTQCARAWIEALGMEELGVCPPSRRPAPSFEQWKTLAAGKIKQRLKNLSEWVENEKQSSEQWRLIQQIQRPVSAEYPWLEEYQALPAPLLRMEGILGRGVIIQSDHLASAQTGPLPRFSSSRLPSTLQQQGLSWANLYPHQQICARTRGQAILCAPTGSGKTESALFWAINQSSERLFYTLPYQASLNAMYARLNALFPNQVGLLHGRSTLSLYRRYMEQSYEPAAAQKLAREQRNLSGLPYYPLRVFTPYQMLKTAFQLKGYEALLTDFAEASFIFDEIHAYEPTRLAMILATVKLLRQTFNAKFFFMSATLPQVIQNAIETTLGQPTIIRASSEIYQRFQRHRLSLMPGDMLEERNLNKILTAFQSGQQVLVTCNTVRRCQQIYQWFKERLPDDAPLFLLHGRFNGRDRVQKEQAMISRCGIGAERHPALLVATQVVEVSLNLDLDVLFSDPAPLEALWQRFGRVNRLGNRPPAPVYIFQEPLTFPYIYSDELLAQTLNQLQTITHNGDLLLNEALVQNWLDAIYTGPILKQWQDEYDKSYHEFETLFINHLMPFASEPGMDEAFDQLFDGLEVLPQSLYDLYQQLDSTGLKLEASALLVPISWGKFHALANRGKVLPYEKGQPRIIDAPYTSESGLNFDE